MCLISDYETVEEILKKVRKLPRQELRVETGIVMFGDDWPGVFIRGDLAMNLALQLKVMRENGWLEAPAGIYMAAKILESLENLFKSVVR